MAENKVELSPMALSILTNIGNNVKFIRKSLMNKKLNEMADFTGVSRDVLCRLEALASGDGTMGKDRVYPSISTLIKLAETYDITLSSLMESDISQDVEVQKKVMSKYTA